MEIFGNAAYLIVLKNEKVHSCQNEKHLHIGIVRVLLCVSCVPASCVHIWFVSCPCFMSLLVKYVPVVFVSLCVNYPLYISPVF